MLKTDKWSNNLKKSAIIISCIALVASGCWDRIEIEEAGFVLGVAIDPVENSTDDFVHEYDETAFQTTFQISRPSQLGQFGDEGGGGAGEADLPFVNLTTSGMTNMKMGRHMAVRNSRPLNYTHLKIIIVHEQLARSGLLDHLLDFFVRDHEMRRRAHVLISEINGKDILEQQVPLDDITSLFIQLTAENADQALEMLEPMEIGTFSERAIGKRGYIIPRIRYLGDGGLSLAGAAVFDGTTNKMLGWLEGEDIEGYKWVVGDAENGVLEVPYGENEFFVFECDEMDTVIEYERNGGADHFHVHIQAEGMYVEDWTNKIDVADQSVMRQLENAVAERIEAEARRIISKMQHDFHVDVFEMMEEVKRKEYDYWQSVRHEWSGEDGGFAKAHINVSSEIQLRHFMTKDHIELD